ncbi:MAG TPA: CBS domain-containing protein [Candidatus Stackebrandtia excrementipullorum]|nr:CBS domain-containing protein [Candidatus Stackebrandtia excrementipullorum]
MTTAREMMNSGATCVDATMTLAEAAQMMRDLQVGSLPICGDDNRLHGIITDRDIVVRCIADGHDPNEITAGQLGDERLIWIDSEADATEVAQMMSDNKIRRLPVMTDNQLVGMISEADLARHLADTELTEFVQAVYAAPPNN